MAHPLEFFDFDGRARVEPSVDARFVVREAARFTGENPFIPTLIGNFDSGIPNTLYEFADLPSFYATLDPESEKGVASECAKYAFKPGVGDTLRGAPLVRCIRAGTGDNLPARSTLSLTDAGDDAVITLTTLDYGPHTKRFTALVEANAVAGKDVTIQYRNVPAWTKKGEKLGPLFTLTGPADHKVTITKTGDAATRLQILDADDATVVDLDLTTTEFNTVAKVVSHLDALASPAMTAVPVAGIGADIETLNSSELDAEAATAIAAGATLTAAIGAIVQWVTANCTTIGPVRGVTAARVATKTAAPTKPSPAGAFTGGSAPASLVAADITAALAVLEDANTPSGLILLDNTTDALREVVLDWIDAQNGLGGMWRAVFGLNPAGATDESLGNIAASLARKRVAAVWERMVDFNGVTKGPEHLAAAFGGATGGMVPAVDVQTAVLTDARLNFASIFAADRRSRLAREKLLKRGLNCVRPEDGGIVISLAISTSQSDKRTLRMWSEATVLDLIEWSAVQAVKATNVAWGTSAYIDSVASRVRINLDGWARADNPVITAGRDPVTKQAVPAYTDPVVVASNGQTRVSFAVGYAGENDHTLIDATVNKVALTNEG